MGSGLKKKARKEPHAYYNPTSRDWQAYRWCINNNIRISMQPQERGMNPQTYKVSISLGENWKKFNYSPQIYDIAEIEEQVWKAYNYYYDKYYKQNE